MGALYVTGGSLIGASVAMLVQTQLPPWAIALVVGVGLVGFGAGMESNR